MTPSNDFDSYLPVYNAIPEEWEDSRQFLTERLREITDSVNAKDFAQYIDRDTLNGQLWLPGTGTSLRDNLRKVVDIGPLPDFGVTSTKTVAHGITFSENTCITRFYGAASDSGATDLTKGIPLPYIQMPGGAHIGIEIDGTNIIITGDGATDYSAYTCAYVVVEWIDEA
jgi:hypothetical protein